MFVAYKAKESLFFQVVTVFWQLNGSPPFQPETEEWIVWNYSIIPIIRASLMPSVRLETPSFVKIFFRKWQSVKLSSSSTRFCPALFY